MQGITQFKNWMSIATPLGADVLRLKDFQGEERVSGLFSFQLTLLAADTSIDFSQLIAQPAGITLILPSAQKRYIHGRITRVVQAGSDASSTTYHAELRPWFWLLTLTQDSRIFQAQTVPQIIETIFGDLGFTDYTLSLTGTYKPREYCVQYQETCFVFVTRLMEEEGIAYWFSHEESKHTLMLTDSPDSHTDCPNGKTLRYGEFDESDTVDGVVRHCHLSHQVTSQQYAADDYNFETPSTDLFVSVDGTEAKYKIYDYPGGFTLQGDGESRANVRIEELERPAAQLSGDTTCAALLPGYTFSLLGYDRAAANTKYLLTHVSHQADHTSYQNTFEAIPATAPFRPERNTRRPRIAGAQTAVVVGKSGEEIWTDQYGRIKVQFHWDQRGKKDENSSCWIRVAQGWAGKSWGSIFLPRIGQEVIVSFLEGDPDRPLITGSVYNAEQTVPYALPGEQTKSTIKSDSSKGSAGFNEMRFEDKKGSEEIYMHAQKDWVTEILHDRTQTIGNDDTAKIKQNRHVTIEEANETLIVSKGDRTINVDTGKEVHTVKATREVTVTGNETHTNKADFTHNITGNMVIKIDGDFTLDVGGKITIKAGTTVNIEAGTSLTNKAGTSLTNQAGTSLTNQAGTTMDNKASASQTVDGGGMLTLKGGLVKIN